MDFSQYVKGNALEISDTTINISELVSFLQINTHITKLSLKNASIGDKGAEALSNLKNLTVLNLRWNKIGDKGVEALSNLKNLTYLNLDCNSIGDKGAEALADSNLINLTALDLSNNSISGPLTAKTILVPLEQKREVVRILDRIMEEKRQDNQSRLREMEDRHQTELTRLREENQNKIREMEERLREAAEMKAQFIQSQAAANDQTTCPDSQLGEVQPISRDQSLGSSRSSGSR